jgi:hypothetical protein
MTWDMKYGRKRSFTESVKLDLGSLYFQLKKKQKLEIESNLRDIEQEYEGKYFFTKLSWKNLFQLLELSYLKYKVEIAQQEAPRSKKTAT